MTTARPNRWTRSLVAIAGSLLIAAPAAAQQGTIKIIVGYPAGATSDALARVVGEAMSQRLKQTVIIENKAGAGGRIANELVKAAAPDGTTLLMTPVATMGIFPHSYPGELKYDPFKDFTAVAHLSDFQVGLGVAMSVPAKTLPEYVAWVKSDPSKNGFYGSAAAGSLPHFFGVMFGRTAGIPLTHVPYKGTAPAMQALAGNEISALSTVAADVRALVAVRQGAPAGRGRAEAQPGLPERADLQGTRLRPGCHTLVRAVRPGRHAAGGGAAAGKGGDRRGQRSGAREAAGRDGPRAHGLRPGSPGQDPEGRL